MPTETQHLEQRVAALQSDLNTKDEQIDALTFSDNDRELSRRSWFDEAKRLEKEVEALRNALEFYADREHYHFESGNWDTVSGEPLNILWCDDEPDFIEDGTVARAALSASAEPAAPRETPAPFAFVYAHPQTAERHTVTVTRDEVAKHMEEELFQKLCECFCECQSVGETNVVDCRCDEVAEQFKLAEPSAPKCCKCNDTGEAVIKGAQPWDKRLSIQCDCAVEGLRAPVERDERAEFEQAFVVQEGVFFSRERNEYRSMNGRSIEYTDATDLNLRLQGWQARAALDKATEGASHE